ncbi:MAG: hypothetical protein WBK55_05960 [Alphaproteobacteria bacterium]
MTEKKFFVLVLIITATLFCLPAGVVIIFDPFFFIHKRYAAIGFDGTDRYQNAGLINSFLADPATNIDTVVLGTSMSQNLPVKIFRNAQGANALKLTLAGGQPRELAAMAEKAIATGHVKTVVWEIYSSYMYEDPDALHKEVPLPLFLYNRSLLDNWRYVFNNDVFEEALKIAKGRKRKRKGLEELYTWENQEAFVKWSSPENLEKLHADFGASNLPLTATPPAGTRQDFLNLEKNLLPVLRNNPDIQFELFFPPVSYYAFARSGNDEFWIQMAMRQKLLDETRDLKNVRIYGFDFIENGPESIKNYMDASHYNPGISAEIAGMIVQRSHVLTSENHASYVRQLRQRVNEFARNF